MTRSVPCPDPQDLERLVLGLLPDNESENLEEHILECDSCVQTVHLLKAEDTLVERMRSGARTVAEAPSPAVEGLIDKLQGLNPLAPAATEMTSGAPVASAEASEGTASTVAPAGDPVPEAATLPPNPDASASPLADTTTELCSFLAPPQAPDEIGRLGPYRVLQVLGAGGMGVVFLAEDPHLERRVALKAMLPAFAASPSARQRFLREAKAGAAIKHDHIVTIHHVGEDRGIPFLSMELLEGESLDDWLRREGKLPVADLVPIGREIAEGLAAAHARGLIHRDIKPGNIWLENSGQGSGVRGQKSEASDQGGLTPDPWPLTPFRVKILDFGLARVATDKTQLTGSGVIIGTPAYMAPEQTRGGSVDHRADLFSLGCVLYRMATGEQPFKGTDTLSILAALSMDAPTPPHQMDQSIPPMLSDLVMQLLAKKPEDRPASAGAVAVALEDISAKTGDWRIKEHRPATSVRRYSDDHDKTGQFVSARFRRSRSRRLIVALAAAAAILLLGGFIYVATDNGRLVIDSNVDDVQVVVSKGGKEYEVIDLKSGAAVKRLPSGDYQISLKGENTDIKLDKGGFTITRWGQVIVTVRREAAERIAAAPGDWIDLLKLVDPKVDAVRGKWHFDGQTLVASGMEPYARLSLPVQPAGNYQVLVKFRRVAGNNGPILNLPVGSHRVQYAIDSGNRQFSALEFIDGHSVDSPDNPTKVTGIRIANDKTYTLEAQVSTTGKTATIRIDLDGKRILDWTGDPARLSISPDWSLGDDSRVGLHPWGLDMRFETVKLSMLSGEAKLLRGDLTTNPDWPRAFAPPQPTITTEGVVADQGGWRIDAKEPRTVRLFELPTPGVKDCIVTFRAKLKTKDFDGRAFLEMWCRIASQGEGWSRGLHNAISGTNDWASYEIPFFLYKGQHSDLLKLNLAIEGKGTVWIKDIEVLQSRPKGTTTWPVGPFVILAADGKAEQAYLTLAEAVAAARDGDTIEIHGNGPIPCEPVTVEKKGLVIRAAPGFAPNLSLPAAHKDNEQPLLLVKAPLVLEGVELVRFDASPWRDEQPSYLPLVRVADTSFHAANCRFTMTRQGGPRGLVAVQVAKSPGATVRLRNCVLLEGDMFLSLDSSRALVSVENCLVKGSGYAVGSNLYEDLAEVRINVHRSTLAGGQSFFCLVFSKDEMLKLKAGACRIEWTENVVLSMPLGVMQAVPKDAVPLRPLELEKQFSQAVKVLGNRNLYSLRDPFSFFYVPPGDKAQVRKLLADWEQLWGLKETGSLQQQVKFKNYDAALRTGGMTVDDFRLLTGTPGKAGGKGGKDLGADVDLVGPGAGYERWKMTPAYQQWLKDVEVHFRPNAKQEKVGELPEGEAGLLRRIHWPVEGFDLAFSRDGRYYAAGSWQDSGNRIRVWDVASGEQIQEFRCDTRVLGILFTPDNKHLLSGHRGAKIRRWDLKTGQEIGSWDAPAEWSNVDDIAPDGKHFTLLVQGPGSKLGNSIRVWATATGQEVLRVDPLRADSWIRGAHPRFSADGRRIGTIELTEQTGKTTFRIHEVATGKLVHQATIDFATCGSLALLDNGNSVASMAITAGSKTHCFARWQMADGKLLHRTRIDVPWIYRPGTYPPFVVSPDGKTVVYRDKQENRVRFFDGNTGTEVLAASVPVPGTSVFSPDGRHALCKGRDGVYLFRLPAPKKCTNSLGMEFALVPKGKSWLGGGVGKAGDKEVEILHDFYLGVYEVTQEEWEKVTGLNPSSFQAVPGVAREDKKRLPVENVSWDDAQAFIKRVNEQVKETGWVYRLPREVEWEYACRGGPMSDKSASAFDFYFEKPTNQLLPDQANFEHGKGLKRTCKVGSYQPNRLGLYDMHGNVWEWCDDVQKGADGASHRVPRGGCWHSVAGNCRAVARYTFPPLPHNGFLGLRLARVPVGKELVKIEKAGWTDLLRLSPLGTSYHQAR